MGTHVMMEKYDMEWWRHNHKEMKLKMKIMVKHLLVDKEQSDQGKDITIGFCFCRSKLSREVIDWI